MLVPLLVILFTPLDYLNLSWTLYHFWITLGYGSFILIYFAKKKEFQRFAIIATLIIVPLSGFFSLIIMLGSPHDEYEITPIPNSKMIVAWQHHSVYMQGNTTHRIEIGYPILRNYVIWRTNSYTKLDYGEDKLDLAPYNLPPEIDYDEYQDGWGIFILEDENLLLDIGKDTIYRTTRKISNSN